MRRYKLRSKRSRRHKLFGMLCFILIWISLEGLVFFTRYDAKLLKPVLSYVQGFPDSSGRALFKVADSNKLYELNKLFASNTVASIQPQEENESIDMCINEFGFRGAFDGIAKKDKKRVLFLGGSNTFGISVSDKDTYTEILARDYGNDYEYINAGVIGYVMSQKIAYAEEIIERYDPDIIILQLFNRGRRSFWYGDKDFHNHFYNNPELFLENIPLLFSDSLFLENVHYGAVKISPLYRFLMAGLNNIKVKAGSQKHDELTYGTVPDQIFKKYYESPFAARKNKEVFERFVDTYGKQIPIFIFNSTVKNNYSETYVDKKDGFYQIVFGNKGLSAEYFDIHPPAYVYYWYAKEIAKALNVILENNA